MTEIFMLCSGIAIGLGIALFTLAKIGGNRCPFCRGVNSVWPF
jgi:hypothetical protein